MKLLDRYIIQKFLVTFIFTLGLFSIIAIFIDLPEKLDDFLKRKPPLNAIIFDYYIYFVPWFFGLFGPIFVFLACIFFTSKLAQNTEIVAMLGSGMSFTRFLRPYMIGAAILAAAFIFLNTYLIPISDKHKYAFEEQWIKEKKITESQNIHVQMEPGSMLHMTTFNYLDSTGFNVSMERFDSSRMVHRITATKLIWNRNKEMWRLEGWRERIFTKEGELLLKGDFKDTVLKIKPSEFIIKSQYISSMTNPELNEYIRIEREKGSPHISKYLVELYRRTASPISFFVLTLLAVSISSRKSRGGTGLALGLGIFVTLFFLLLVQVFNTFGITNVLPPAIAVWMPNMIYLFVALYFAAKAPK
jgi:lipopolysaccharide export system permease protein